MISKNDAIERRYIFHLFFLILQEVSISVSVFIKYRFHASIARRQANSECVIIWNYYKQTLLTFVSPFAIFVIYLYFMSVVSEKSMQTNVKDGK